MRVKPYWTNVQYLFSPDLYKFLGPFGSLYEFFPGKSFDDLLAIYAVFGMIPAYLEKVFTRSGVPMKLEYAEEVVQVTLSLT